MYAFPAIWLLASTIAMCAQRPEFQAASVIPTWGDLPSALAPGMLVSIYGYGLGPEQPCQAFAGSRRLETPNPARPRQMQPELLVYPTELCGVRVTIAGKPAGLSYVQDKQINLNVPQDVPVEGIAEMQVIYHGAPSVPVEMKLGLETVVITLEEPAYAGLPVWLRLHTSHDTVDPIQYPFDLRQTPFRCQQLEVRDNESLMPRTLPKLPLRMFTFSGNPCGSTASSTKQLRGRVPAHLEYRFDRPGAYEVRYTRTAIILKEHGETHEVIERSEWTRITVLPASPGQRQEWLAKLVAKAPSGTEELLYDFLPSILGYGDLDALRIAIGYLYHPDEQVRRYTMDWLATYYDASTLAPALQYLMRTNGTNRETERLLREATDKN